MPALIGRRAAAVVAPVADAFDAAADAAANADADAAALTLSIRNAQWSEGLKRLGRHSH